MYNYYGDTMNSKWKKIVVLIISIFLIIILLFGYCRYIETKRFRIKEYAIRNSSIPESFYGTKIIHISDIHYKSTTNYNDLKKIINKINLTKPDIVIFTGDIFDKNIKYTNKDFEDIKKLLKSIDYNIAKYAIKGNEDLKISKWEEIINDSDFINLNDTYDLIYNEGIDPLLLVGISSNYKNNHIKDTVTKIKNEINAKYSYSILMFHEPDFFDEIDAINFNLALAGHSLGGEIVLPFANGVIREKYSKKYYKNYYRVDFTNLFISSGIGTNNHKLRFRNKPSVNLYRLRNK